MAEDEALNEDVLLSMGFHKKSYGSFEGRVFLEGVDNYDASLTINDMSIEDTGMYRCEMINGMVDTVQEVSLEVLPGLIEGKSSFSILTSSSGTGLISSHIIGVGFNSNWERQ